MSPQEADTAESAVFPLSTVLLPGQLLQLQVFEPRYRVMLFDLREAVPPEFVVVMIERGREVGGGDVRSEVGCVACVLDAEELPDGRVMLETVGTQRVRVRRWLPDDPYPRAEVEPLVDPEEVPPGPDRLEAVLGRAREVDEMVQRLGGPAWPAPDRLATDPEDLLWQLALLAPLGTLDRQRLLGTVGLARRWDLLEEMLEEQCQMLAARIDWDGPPST